MWGGIALGVGAAWFQVRGYETVRTFVAGGGSPRRLFVASQLVMGGIGLLLLPWLWSSAQFADLAWLPWLLGCALGTAGGQFFFFRAEEQIGPARIASLMGLRVVILAGTTTWLLNERYSWPQLAGVALAALSAILINWEGGKIDWRGMGPLSLSLAAYAISDVSVQPMIDRLPGNGGVFHHALLAMLMVNALLFAICLPFFRKLTRADLTGGGKFASVWLLKQYLLYSCFALIGPVFCSVVMSSRGPISVARALVRLKRDSKINWPLWTRRIAATLLMVAAIVLYLAG